jgi:hypothetical protein
LFYKKDYKENANFFNSFLLKVGDDYEYVKCLANKEQEFGQTFNIYSTHFSNEKDKDKSDLISDFGDTLKKISIMKMFLGDTTQRKFSDRLTNVLEDTCFKGNEEEIKEELLFQKEYMDYEFFMSIKDYISSNKKHLQETLKMFDSLDKKIDEMSLPIKPPKRKNDQKVFGRYIDPLEPVPKVLKDILEHLIKNSNF